MGLPPPDNLERVLCVVAGVMVGGGLAIIAVTLVRAVRAVVGS